MAGSEASPLAATAKGERGARQEFMTRDEVIAYLRLDADERNPQERLRNLERRQRLPVIKKGKLRLYRRSAIDTWLDKRR
jgi:hypothetical protein